MGALRLARDLDGHVAIRRCANAELAGRVAPPAVHARVRDGARVTCPGAYRSKGEATRHEHRARPLGRRPITELTVAAQAPAIHVASHPLFGLLTNPGAVTRHSAGMASPRAYGGEVESAAHEPPGGPISRCPIAQLAVAVGTPAVQGSQRLGSHYGDGLDGASVSR